MKCNWDMTSDTGLYQCVIILQYPFIKKLKIIIMKKIITLFVAFFGGLQVFGINQQDKGDDIFFYEDRKVLQDTRSRSIGPVVEGRVDYDMGQIEIAINTYIGVATITLVDSMGAALSTISCDNETEWGAYLPIPACAGAYTLKIDSPVAEFTGSFIVD